MNLACSRALTLNIVFDVDGRLEDWLLMSSPWPTIAMTIAYLIICKVGPKFMENRKPWQLRGFIVIYNFCLVLLSAYMFIEVSESIRITRILPWDGTQNGHTDSKLAFEPFYCKTGREG